MIHGGLDWSEAAEYTIQKTWQHPRMPGMVVTRVFKVWSPTDKGAQVAAHLHFLMALNGMGLRFRRPDSD